MTSRLLRVLVTLILSVACVPLPGGGGLAAPLHQDEPAETPFEALPVGNADLDSPRSAMLGAAIEIGAEGFTPGAPILVVLMGPGPASYYLPVDSGSPVADGSGRARWTVRLPATLVAERDGTWWLSADDADGHFANRAIDLEGMVVRSSGPPPAPRPAGESAPEGPIAEPPAESDISPS
jgi:hypothetical protein